MSEETDVLIVGAGLAGLSTAVFLGLHGVRALLIERRAGTSILPKARGQNPVTMEAMRSAGLAEAIIAARPPGKPGITSVVSVSMAGPILFDHVVNRPDFSQFSPELPGLASQAKVEAALARRARELGVDLRFDTLMQSFRQDDEGVTVELRDTTIGENRSVRARYMVAADGIRGEIAQQLGAKRIGRGHLTSVTAVRFLADLEWLAGNNCMIVHYIQNPGVPDGAGVLVSTDNVGEWVANMSADPNRSEAETAAIIRTMVGVPDLKLEIIGSVSFDYGHWVTDRMKFGRILLAGDAAHVMPPTGGQGGNTAVQDGFYLGWKLAMVVRGLAGPALLDSYEPERMPYARAVADWQAANLGERRRMDKIANDIGKPMDHATLLFGYACTKGAFIPDPTAENIPFENPATPSGRPGSRIPYARLHGAEGELNPRRLLGPYFAVYTTAPNGAAIAEHAARDFGIALKTFAVESVEPLGAEGCDTVLVRPDGIIAWRGKGPEGINAALRTVLCR